MPFDATGRFIPTTAMTTVPTAARAPLAQSVNQNMMMARPAMQTALAQNAYGGGEFPQAQNLQRFNQVNQRFAGIAGLGQQAPQAPNPNPPGPPPPPAPPPPAQQAVQAAPQGPQAYQRYSMSQLGMPGNVAPAPAPVQAPAPGLSPTQQAGRGNAQSVQNYLTALGQAGANTNNAAMNRPGQLGAGPQAGFTGFGQQPGYGPQYVPQGYTGQVSAGPSQVYNPNLQYQGNQAYAGQNYNIGNYAYQGNYGQMASPQLANTGGISMVNAPGLLAGAQNAPQFQTPAPWGNPQNAPPGSPGSAWGGDEAQNWENYFFSTSPYAPGTTALPGGMYSNAAPGGPQYDAQGNPIPGSTTVSDVQAKTNIQDAQGELQEFLDALGVYSYEYKNPEHGEGRRISPMAQEFEKSQLGAQAVSTGQDGIKRVDYGKLAGVQTAALALLNHKINKLQENFEKSLKDNITKRGNRG